jgi:hypothetical protein
MRYFENLVNDALATIHKFGSYVDLVS